MCLVFLIQAQPSDIRAQSSADPEQKAQLVVQTGHTMSVRSIAISHDGRLLASAGEDLTVKIWDIEAERELRTFKAHTRSIVSVVFSPDDRTLATSSYDGTVKLWDVETGKKVATTPTPEDSHDAAESLVFSADGRMLAVTSLSGVEGRIKILDGKTLREIVSMSGHTFWAQLAFSPDGRLLASSEKQESIKIWNTATGLHLRTLTGKIYDQFTHNTSKIVFSADGKTIATGGSDRLVRLWDAVTGAELKIFRGHTNRVSSVFFTLDGKRLISSSWDKTIRYWDIETATEIESLRKTDDLITVATLSDDGRMLAAASKASVKVWNLAREGPVRRMSGNVFTSLEPILSVNEKILAVSGFGKVALWNLASNTRVALLDGHRNDLKCSTFSPDGKLIATGGGFSDGNIKLWDTETGREIKTLAGHVHSVLSLSFSPDGKLLASGGDDRTTRLWDVATGRLLRTLTDGSREHLPDMVTAVAFTPDGLSIARSNLGGVLIWNVNTGAVEKNLGGTGESLFRMAFSPDGNFLASKTLYENRLIAWDLRTGAKIHDLENVYVNRETIRKIAPAIVFDDDAVSAKFSVAVEENSKIKIFDRASRTELASLVAFTDASWAVVTPDGLFDASPEARRRMHYVLGLEAVTLDQMKDVYYVPGLLQKIHSGASLPKIGLFSARDLFPDVEFDAPKPGATHLPVRITDRGGGIGQVQVLVNGKEFIRDARPVGAARVKRLDLTISLKDAPLRIEGENLIEIVARNAAGSLTNRGTPRAAERFVIEGGSRSRPEPNIYIIAGGISRYAAENLNLNFAAKDAEDFAKAVEVGALKLLKGDRTKVHVRLLTSNSVSAAAFSTTDSKTYGATKSDFERAFADFKGATSDDVFIVYLAGHGISIGQDGVAAGNTYLYLTQEATTTDRSILALDATRRVMAVSSDELKDMMRQNKALKQVLILDTCAAGAASGSFVAKRDVPADQIGALERLKDNTGFYILMGSAADSVSYEASQYGQGLLTYSLLQGMKGARLRDDQFADVELLFGYAKDTVGSLAKHIGGIQRPETIMPDASRSFDIGEFTAVERQKINTLATPVPLVLRPRLTNPKLRYDSLGLERIFRSELRKASLVVRGIVPTLMFVESDEMPDAYLPSGDYSVEGEIITINLILVRNDRPAAAEIIVTGNVRDKEDLIRRLIDRIAAATRS